MERVRNAFLILLRSGLWGRNPMAEGFTQLSDEQWDLVSRMAERQTVTAIVFDGICRLPDELQPSVNIITKWVAGVDRIERSNTRMNMVLKELTGILMEGGLKPVLQKGQGIAALYPTPLHRECGDIDFYFYGEMSGKSAGHSGTHKDKAKTCDEKAAELMRSHEAEVEREPDGSWSYEWKDTVVELHPAIVDLSSPGVKKWVHELDDDPGFIPSSLADGLLEPAPELNALLLNAHILKHALGKGIGLRQMCDLAMVYHRISIEGKQEECGGRIARLYGRAGILKWSRLLHSFLVEVTGLPEAELPYSEKMMPTAPLLKIVEQGGNLGKHHSGCNGDFVQTGRQCALKSKLHTAGMFFRRAGFSMRFAPREAFWTFAELAKGQFIR
jgi:hypothetical protein